MLERVHCTVLRTRNSLDLCMVNLMEDSEEHELGPWHLSLEVAGGSSFGQFNLFPHSILFRFGSKCLLIWCVITWILLRVFIIVDQYYVDPTSHVAYYGICY